MNLLFNDNLLASGWLRLLNYIIDTVAFLGIANLLYVILLLLDNFFGGYYTSSAKPGWVILSFFIFAWLLCYFTFEAIFQRTPGKYLTGTKVVTFAGNKPPVKTIFIRTICRLNPFDGYSFKNATGGCCHDLWSRTVVVNVRKFNEATALNDSINEIGEPEQ